MRLRCKELLRDIQLVSDREKNKMALPASAIKGGKARKQGSWGTAMKTALGISRSESKGLETKPLRHQHQVPR